MPASTTAWLQCRQISRIALFTLTLILSMAAEAEAADKAEKQPKKEATAKKAAEAKEKAPTTAIKKEKSQKIKKDGEAEENAPSNEADAEEGNEAAMKTEPPPAKAPTQNRKEAMVIYEAEKAKTKPKLLIPIEKSKEFAEIPQVMGRYETKAFARKEERTKIKAEPATAPVPAAKKAEGQPAPAKATPAPGSGSEGEEDEGDETEADESVKEDEES